MTPLPKLAGLAEVASFANDGKGVSRQRAAQLAAHPDFPSPSSGSRWGRYGARTT